MTISSSLSGLRLFSREILQKVMSENPGMESDDVQKKIQRLWTELSDAEKAQYVERANGCHRPPSGFMIFMKEIHSKVKDENPGMPYIEITKKIGRMWRELSDKEKDAYNEKSRTWQDTTQATKPN